MKNLAAFVDQADIYRHIDGLWRTEEFRERAETDGFIRRLVDEFSRSPRFFADMTDERLETAHFSTWWNVIMNRQYDNPYVADLYLLHEMYHAARMPYVPGIGKAAFDEKMQRNELEASVFSEISIYFDIPGLREKTFPFPIYADRFLDDPAMRAQWRANRNVAVETIRTIRRDVMVSKAEREMDDTETWIRRFADQNAAYSIIWADRYNEVEGRMARFHAMATQDRQGAADYHMAWMSAEQDQDGIPFRQEAELFSAHYWANKRKYQAAHLAA